MNPLGKKFISLFLIFSLMILSVNLYAKERRGAKLIVTKLDGQLIKGELITVKPNSLLLLDTEGKDVSVGIEDIKVIKIAEKLGVAWGALVGLLGGAGFGAYFAGMWSFVLKASWGEASSLMAKWGAICAPFGAIIGAILGDLLLKVSKTIQIEGKSDTEIQEAMDKLRKKARIRDYK